ncbi:MAG: apolipoprotein N-acyltransferase [Chitinophagaceae bacterium]|nr:apolipoprotein N-acyltransferase [Chitinophagaceae bacterium]
MSPLTILIFIAWLPLLWIEDNVSNWKKISGLTYLHMLVWNILVTWWVSNASLPGALGAFFANSLIMCVPWILLYFTKRKFGRWIGYGSLIVYWLTFEYIHHNWELTWPWLTLGNSFALHPEWVQWYEYSGTTGGSLWVLLSNVLAYALFAEYRNSGRTKSYYITMISWVLVLLVPILSSKLIASGERKYVQSAMAKAGKNVVVVQPNIDPYTEKFTGDIESQVQKLIVLSESMIDDDTRLVIWPETAVPAQVWEDQIKYNYFYYPIWSLIDRHPQISLLTGIDSYKKYGTNKNKAPKSARFESSSGVYYDAFNTAAFIDADTAIDLYHKAKLVPGVETLPSFLSFMGKWFESFGGISGTLGRDSERKVFTTWDKYYKASPVICYESIFSDYITEYIRNGGNILTILTNDGWWGNTPGYKQHMNYARLRAIESRKWVARSANTGISCFIDPLGNVIDPQPWDTAAAIKLAVPVDERKTFFVKHGDILSRAVSVISGLLLMMNIFVWAKRRFKRSKV